MGLAVVEQWQAELKHCREFGDTTGVERAVGALRSLGVEPDAPKVAPKPAPVKRAVKKAAPKAG